MPQVGSRQQTAEARKGSHRNFTPEVRTALKAFGLNEQATFDEVRRAYRDLVKSYHPDMVAHLGPELKRVAEQKTKEINSVYGILETFYIA
jgi:DnaJ-domain-containing protein 1